MDEFIGINIDHHDVINDNYSGTSAPCGPAEHYHGTAVASLIAGRNIGVASNVKLVDLRTYPCSGYNTRLRNVIGAFNWIVSDGSARWNVDGVNGTDTFGRQFYELRDWPVNPDRDTPGVVNLSGLSPAATGIGDDSKSFYYPYSFIYQSVSLEAAVRDVVDAGNVVVTSANNYSRSCAKYSPSVLGYNGDGVNQVRDLDSNGRVTTVYIPPSVITVGATNRHDERWVNSQVVPGEEYSGSNSGPCISLWAPGADILVARQGNTSNPAATNMYVRNSGTSFAAPVVSGVAARYIETYRGTNFGASPTPFKVFQYLTDTSTNFRADGVTALISNTVASDGSEPRKSTKTGGQTVPVGMVYRHGATECRHRLVTR